MAQKQIDPNQMSNIELKALAYDMMVEIESMNRNLNTVNQIVAKRIQEANATQPLPTTTVETAPEIET